MKTPSIKTLSLVFDNPSEAKRVLQMTRIELDGHPVGAARNNECYNRPKTYDVRLTVLNSLDTGLYGVESIESTHGEYAEYLNTGDCYIPTLIYWRGNYRVQSIGDFIENNQAKFI